MVAGSGMTVAARPCFQSWGRWGSSGAKSRERTYERRLLVLRQAAPPLLWMARLVLGMANIGLSRRISLLSTKLSIRNSTLCPRIIAI